MSGSFQVLKDIDFNHLWHPFTQQKLWFDFDEPLIIEAARGFELIDVEGRSYLDGVSSLWCNVHGHGVPELCQALKDQVDKLCHSTLLGLSHVPVLELTEKLLAAAPSHFSRVFYSDSGAAAVEAALRMSIEWWQKQPQASAKKKTRLVSMVGGYHGDTLGAVGAAFVEDFHMHVRQLVVSAEQLPPPHVFRLKDGLSEQDALEASISSLECFFEKEAAGIAALIMEPLVQGAAGIWVHPVEFLNAAGDLCKKHDVLLIVDEVATGFGKTGKMFACQHASIEADIMTIGKGLSAGYLPISAALATERIFEGFLGEPEERNALYFGQTFAGNPLAAKVGACSLDLYEKNHVFESLPGRIQHYQSELQNRLSGLAHVSEVRFCGLMAGVELCETPGEHSPYPAESLASWRVVKKARELGVVIRPIGNVIILMPALMMGLEDITRLVAVAAEAIHSELGEN